MSDDSAPATPSKAAEPPLPAASHSPAAGAGEVHHGHASGSLLALTVGALGVVYGDVGTSPLYTIKECFTPGHGVEPTLANVLGVLSLIVWSLILVVGVKYVSFILRADNQGEGGVLALLALVTSRQESGDRDRLRSRAILVVLGLFGSALLYGDGIITPAISVLSAVEGLEVATTSVRPFVLPITLVILVGLFLVQKHGTAGIGRIFGPATGVWFVSIAAAGLPWIARRPEVLGAVNPLHGMRFFYEHGLHGFLLLGSVVLCITGGEALYADMGHFGRKPIRWAWYTVVFPALIINYMGQGAVLLERGEAVRANPFFGLLSGWLVYPMVAVATVATVVASQALISGAFSLTQQAVQLGYCPRVTIVHTSGSAEGQIYIPEVNRILMVACLALVLAFRKSSNLAAAYGIALTITMTITSILFFQLTRQWKWAMWKSVSLVAVFLALDLAFFGANVVKVVKGGWFPLAIASAVFIVMTTWKKGRRTLGNHIIANTLPTELFLNDVESTRPHRVTGTAVFMTSNPDGAPPVLLHHFKHNKVLHEQVILLSVQTRHVPEVPASQRLAIRELGHGFWQVTATYGFMETPNVLECLTLANARGLPVDPQAASFYLGRETLLTSGRSSMAQWRKVLFAILSRNARPANMFFNIPPNRVVELGTQIEL
ncbi:MAG: potassium transporter Kup [Deltaproteobacteria bacterium]|nr:potassium transporter Kup [Myxococcales bacterium]MDP3219913.1 potassium transporter Kup [Deltaproteobacteria bacterium]